MSEGDCRAASQQYLEFGIELLGSDCWEEEYGLTLALYNASAEIEYGTANFEHVECRPARVDNSGQGDAFSSYLACSYGTFLFLDFDLSYDRGCSGRVGRAESP